MIVSRKIKILCTPAQKESINRTAEEFSRLFNSLTEQAWKMRSPSRFRLHRAAYRSARKQFPSLPSQYVVTAVMKANAAVLASRERRKLRLAENRKRVSEGREPLKEVSCPIMRKAYCMDLDMRLATIHKDSVKVTLMGGRSSLPLKQYPYILKDWQYRRSGCELVKRDGEWFLAVCFDLPEPPFKAGEVIGVDRGVNNIAVCSDNRFYNSKKLKAVKGRYRYNRSVLQSKGTKSAHRALRRVNGKENRFVRDVNHCISKSIVNSGFGTIALEKLDLRVQKRLGRSFNKKLGNWSWSQLEQFVRYKAALKGVSCVSVPAPYSSQRCSKCGHTEKRNRKGSEFQCKACGFQLHSDLNAARNIAFRAKCPESRLPSISQTAGQPANVFPFGGGTSPQARPAGY